MLTAIARLSLRAPRRMAAAALVAFLALAVVGGPTAGILKDRNSFQDPSKFLAAGGRKAEDIVRSSHPFQELASQMRTRPPGLGDLEAPPRERP